MTAQATDSGAQVRELFDAKAATWSAKYATGGRLTGRLARLAAAVEDQVPHPCRVMDLGCGTGDLARHLAGTGLRVTGCDISSRMLRGAAQADAAATVEWVQLDPGWHTLPFADAAFAAIVASSVLEYVDDPVQVLHECARVLRPGATLVCTVPNLRHPVRWLEWLAAVAARGPVGWASGHHHGHLGSYVRYLKVSRQRHSARWWNAAGERAGLRLIPGPASASGRSPLRLLSFRVAGETSSMP